MHMESVFLYDLLSGFSRALGLAYHDLRGHNVRVAYLTQLLANFCEMEPQERKYLLVATMLHEIGTIPKKNGLTNIVFEKEDYCIAGWAFCRTAKLPEAVCNMVLLRKTPWQAMGAIDDNALAANCIYLADFIDAQAQAQPELPFAEWAAAAAEETAGSFSPACLKALAQISLRSDLTDRYPSLSAMEAYLVQTAGNGILSIENLLTLCDLFSQIIDSKSPFTATHSHGVARTAQAILMQTGLASDEDGLTIYMAGLLHDIGKLAVPVDILEKAGPLSSLERQEIKEHAKIGVDMLRTIPGFRCVCDWGGMHHERLDGGGYPYGLGAEKLSLPMRVMAVADVFTAMTENRPYRPGMELSSVLECMSSMAAARQLDGDVVDLVTQNALQINKVRSSAQRDAAAKFLSMRKLCCWTLP